MESLCSNEVWELVEAPKNHKVVGSKLIFKCKLDSDGNLQPFMALPVAPGYSQQFGLDYEETFSPVICFESLQSIVESSQRIFVKAGKELRCAISNEAHIWLE